MGPCAGCCSKIRTSKTDNMKLANNIFINIDTRKEGQLNQANLREYFKEYTETSVKIILDGIDFNQDKVITKSQWMAYWEYVRLAGNSDKAIFKSLKKIDQGIAHLGFPGAANYKTSQPRDTLIKGIERQIQNDPAVMPFMLEPS